MNDEHSVELPTAGCLVCPKDFFSWSSGNFLPKKNQEHGQIPVFGGNGINGYHNEAMVDSPTIVVGRVGAHCGNVHLTKGPAWITDNAIYAVPQTSEICLRFWQLALSSQNLNARAGGTGQPYVNQKHLNGLSVPLPPLPEQDRIVEAIESYFTRMDDAVATLERVQRNLKRYRASVLRAAVEGRLVPTEAALACAEGRQYETASGLLERILEERRRRWKVAGGRGRYKEPVEPDIDGLHELPDGWAWTSFGSLCGIRGGFAFKSKDYLEGKVGVPVVRQSDLRSRFVSVDTAKHVPSSFWEDYERKYAVRRGDFMVGLSGSLSSVSQYGSDQPALQNQRTGLLQPSSLIDPRFALMTYLALVPEVERAGKGVAVQNVAPRTIEAMPIPLPPAAEQVRIVAELERKFSSLDVLFPTVKQNLLRCTRLRQSILKWAFEGKLADQDPDDEPASALLERICAEREAAAATKKPKRRGRPRKRKNA